MANSKVITYLGFAYKAGKATLGTDRIEMLKRAPEFVLVDRSLSENSKSKMRSVAERFKISVYETDGLGELLHRPACKAVAVSEKNLAEALKKEMDQDGSFRLLYQVGNGGNK